MNKGKRTPQPPRVFLLSQTRITVSLFSLLFLISIFFFYLHWPMENTVWPVAGHHYYLSQQIYRGEVLYRDLFIDKPPLTELIGAGCFLICSGKLIPAIILTRWVFFLFFMLSAVPLFVISKTILKKSYLTWLTIIIFLSFNFPYEKLARSADWHVLMVFFGLASLALYLRNRRLICGLTAAMAFLSWQPGIIYIIAVTFAVLLFTRVGRLKKLTGILILFLLPVGLTIVYVWCRGSFSDMIEQTVLYGRINVGDGFLEGIKVIPERIRISYSRNIPIMLLGILGFALNWLQVVRGGGAVRKMYFFPLSLLSMVIIISLIDFQSSRDVIPALPWLSFYAVFLIDRVPGSEKSPVFRFILILFLAGLVIYSLVGTVKERPHRLALQKQQEKILAELERWGLGEGESILCMESVLPCLFLERKNLTRHVYYLQDKHYLFIQTYEEGGFDSVSRAVDKNKPRLIRIAKCPWSKEDWPKKRFDPLRVSLTEKYRLIEDQRQWLYVRKEEDQ